MACPPGDASPREGFHSQPMPIPTHQLTNMFIHIKGGFKWVSKKMTWNEVADGRKNPDSEHHDAEKQMADCIGEGTGRWRKCVNQEEENSVRNKSCSQQNMCNGLADGSTSKVQEHSKFKQNVSESKGQCTGR